MQVEYFKMARDHPWHWEISYWRAFPSPRWVVIARSRHSEATFRLLRGLWERQPEVIFRMRLCMPPAEATTIPSLFVEWQAAS